MIYYRQMQKLEFIGGNQMFLYSIIMFSVAIPFIWISLSIYKGKTELIHDYHQSKVEDKIAYGKDFGKAMFAVSAGMLLSGMISLFGDSEAIAKISLAVLFVGIIIGIVCIIIVQKKYNNGIF